MLSFVVSIFAAAGTANAQSTAPELTSYPFISAIPKTANVGETVLINFGLLNNLMRQTDGWNVTAVITDPDGGVEKLSGMTWSTGTVGKYYTPSKEGEYKLVCEFERVFYNNRWYAASKSETFILTATVGGGKTVYPGHNLPSEYWTRPIDGQLREWYSISGSWFAMPINRIAENNAPVLSPHVLWSMPIGDNIGGLAGGDYAFGYQDGDAYEGRWLGNIIIGGIMYYDKVQSGMPTTAQCIVAVDIHTGEKLWEKRTESLGRIVTGQTLSWFSYNSRGAWSYVWIGSGSNMYALEAATGDIIYNMTNVPGNIGTTGNARLYYGPNGELIKYIYSNLGTTANPDWHLRQWNSSVVVVGPGADQDVSWGSACRNRTFNATERGFDIDIALGATDIVGNIIWGFPEDRVIIGSTAVQASNSGAISLTAISVKKGEEGVIYKNVRWATPVSFEDIQYESYRQSDWCAVSQDVVVFFEKNSRVNYGFNVKTGEYLWKTAPQTFEDAWMAGTLNIATGCYNFHIIAYGKLIAASVGGVVYCYDLKNGSTLWEYPATDLYKESYMAENWWLCPVIATNGIIYFGVEEHSTLEPKPRGAPFFALDAETGAVVWKIDGMFRQSQWGGHAMIGDSIIVTADSYDQMIYAIGKGPTSVTVTAPNVAVTAGTPVLLKGTVMDVSPFTQSIKSDMRFAKGVPAVSEESMNGWMLYIFKQFDRPSDITGVPISLVVLDANGNYEELSTVSDESGNFAVAYTPSVEGECSIYAYYDGSNSYYGNWAQDSMFVAEAPTTSNLLTYGLYVIGIVAIVAVLLFGLLILRKK